MAEIAAPTKLIQEELKAHPEAGKTRVIEDEFNLNIDPVYPATSEGGHTTKGESEMKKYHNMYQIGKCGALMCILAVLELLRKTQAGFELVSVPLCIGAFAAAFVLLVLMIFGWVGMDRSTPQE